MNQEQNIEEIIEGCRLQDASAQRQLYDKYNRFLYAICLRYLDSRMEADDLLVDSFLKIYQQIGTFKGDEKSFVAWMKRIVVNGALDMIRYNSRRVHVDINSEDTVAIYDTVVVSSSTQLEQRDLVEQAMRTLDPMYREILNMVAIDEYSFAEASKQLQQPESTLKSRYYRACEMMRSAIQKVDFKTWKQYKESRSRGR